MPEHFSYIPKSEIGHFWKSVVPKEKGISVKERYFPSAIGVIGGGTGLEALRLARENPGAAIFVVDPYSRFASNVIDQMTAPEYKSRRKIDWTFFEKDAGLQYVHEQLWDTYHFKPELWKKVNKAFSHYNQDVKELADRIYFIEGKTSDYIPEIPILDRVDLVYPNPQLYHESSLYKFVSRGLRKDGTWTIITESPEGYIHYFGYEMPFVESHGTVQRKSINNPLSVYDIIFPHSYKFIDIRKLTDKLKEPSMAAIILSELFFPWVLWPMINELISKKKVVRKQ
ncbi:MAG: hypothetical protein UR68_C0020G0021 [Candidatus Roizmanbacteria bacterium GW2011_GWA2_35_19]|uniref:Uncharacterized protein n=1 Tax=Candidatus Roizmanbacteria bacterium GW2011_GWA2_35_19 TaxID=1618478 RepID=A0A0G0C7N5_9BACT|nr:MAG: hypothetical protein UR68_C0020G0021 [Candidatus Roizmanbacteria bacterium GW2011_GWA2_35_19]